MVFIVSRDVIAFSMFIFFLGARYLRITLTPNSDIRGIIDSYSKKISINYSELTDEKYFNYFFLGAQSSHLFFFRFQTVKFE